MNLSSKKKDKILENFLFIYLFIFRDLILDYIRY
jgi:hypothetical protein